MHILYTRTRFSNDAEPERDSGKLTDEDDMIIQLPLILALTVHLRHLLKRIKHRLHDLLIRHIDALSDLERVGIDKLAFDSGDVDGKRLDEGCYAIPFLAR